MEELVPGNSLITETPQEGRELAILMARKSIRAIQMDGEDRLIDAAHVVAVEFATVAAANHYWREPSWKRDYRRSTG